MKDEATGTPQLVKYVPTGIDDLYCYAQRVAEQSVSPSASQSEIQEMAQALSGFLHLMARLEAKRLNAA
jgi:hypothetical protein